MEPHSFFTGLGTISHLEGLALVLGVFALLWYSSFRSLSKSHSKTLAKLHELYQGVMAQYKADLAGLSTQHLQAAREMRQMYDSNVVLVEKVVGLAERYEKRGEYLEKLITTNIQTMQQCTDTVDKCRRAPGAI